MNRTMKTSEHKSSILNVAFDVSMETLNFYTEIDGDRVEGEFANQTLRIEQRLRRLLEQARDAGFVQIQVVCESTGMYHRSLLSVAVRMGVQTALVNGEAVAKFRVVQSNDDSKTDLKDPRSIFLLAQLGKTLIHRKLSGNYEILREWHGILDAADEKRVQAKCVLHHELRAFFPDCRFSKEVLYGPTGAAFIHEFGANPYRVVAAGKDGFKAAMRAKAKNIKTRTLERIWTQAVESARHPMAAGIAKLHEKRVGQLYEEYELHQGRFNEAGREMEGIYREICEEDKRVPRARKGVISELGAARLLAETGPLDDFVSDRQVLRYGGLNLRERQSGKYRGRTKISKKGRPLLRKVLSLIVFPLVKQDSLLATYYRRKKNDDKMPGNKAMTVMMRKFLKMFIGWHRSQAAFDDKRVFLCESEYRRAA